MNYLGLIFLDKRSKINNLTTFYKTGKITIKQHTLQIINKILLIVGIFFLLNSTLSYAQEDGLEIDSKIRVLMMLPYRFIKTEI